MEDRRDVARHSSHPVFTVSLTDGLADRNRLPLDHVIRVLTEMKSLIEEVGKRIQRERGEEKATGNFGLELDAGLKPGSVQADILITKDINIGVDAAAHVIEMINSLNSQADPGRAELDPRVLARLNNTSKILEIDKTALKLRLTAQREHQHTRRIEATFDQQSADRVAKYAGGDV